MWVKASSWICKLESRHHKDQAEWKARKEEGPCQERSHSNLSWFFHSLFRSFAPSLFLAFFAFLQGFACFAQTKQQAGKGSLLSIFQAFILFTAP
jgi:hypothetical protein